MTSPKVPAPAPTAERIICPNCASTETHWLPEQGLMRCDYCRSTFSVDNSGLARLINDDVAGLAGVELSAGAGQDVVPESDDHVHTFRCPACGADIVVEAGTSEATVKCHWCRNNITTADRVPNSARPDGIIPFAVSRDQAKAKMEEFLKRRRAFANRRFLAEYSLENIQPVYFPYFIVDIRAHSQHQGQGAHLVRQYTSGDKDNNTTYYDYDVYHFEREFDLYVNDLLIENNLDFATINTKINTNNIINSIAPWNTQQLVPYDAHYLQGEYRAEPRTGNIEQVRPTVLAQLGDISHVQANATMPHYDHGVRYQSDDVALVGERWLTALCPVWLYSYRETGPRPMLHYIAVNGSTGETMGSVPINHRRILLVSAVVEAVAVVAAAVALIAM